MIQATRPAPPSDDKRWKLVQAEMSKHGFRHDALIQALHAVQGAFGYVDREALEWVAGSLRVPLSKAWGVATFYHYFTMEPPGRHTCVMCTGTACYIKGVPALLKAIRERYGIGLGETTDDGELSLLSARCVGACGLAPVAVVDGKTLGELTADKLLERLDEVLA